MLRWEWKDWGLTTTKCDDVFSISKQQDATMNIYNIQISQAPLFEYIFLDSLLGTEW